MNPTDATHDFVLAEAPPALALLLLVLLLLLLLLQPATASEPTAAATRTRRPFIGYASISGISHNVGFPIERTAFRLMACRHIGASWSSTGAARSDGRRPPRHACQEAQYALPNGPISYR
jgi:predicted membrane protein